MHSSMKASFTGSMEETGQKEYMLHGSIYIKPYEYTLIQ